MRCVTTLACLMFIVGLVALLTAASLGAPLAGDDQAPQPKTLAYDGFATGTAARAYLPQLAPSDSGGPITGTVGFDSKQRWSGNTNHMRMRTAGIRSLQHKLLRRTQPGSLGHWTFKGKGLLRRRLASTPTAKSGVFSLCLLYRAHDNAKCNLPLTKNHTTNFPGAFALIGFAPAGEGANASKRGVGLGYFEDDLRVFAGGKSFSILEEYQEDTTYLLAAEITVNIDGPEFVRGFYASEKDDNFLPAPFNTANGGKGVRIETWKSKKDLSELQIIIADTTQLFFPQASRSDLTQDDFITWDEVRLLDGAVATPIPSSPQEAIATNAAKHAKGLVAYWSFDEGNGQTTKDAIGQNHLTLKRATFTPHHIHGGAALELGNFAGTRGSGMASLPFAKAEKNGLAFERGDKLTFSAWVRGRTDGRWGGLNDIVTMSRSGQTGDNKLRDVRGLEFSLANYRLRFSLIHAVNFPQKDNRLIVVGSRKVADDADFHHVAVTYDGSSKSKGVCFYVDGVKDKDFSINYEDKGCALTGNIAVACPFNIGGRNDDHKDLFRFGFDGYIDEVGVFREVLTAGEVAAIHALGRHKNLKINLKQANQLIQLHRAKRGESKIGKHTWQPVANGTLNIGVGELQMSHGVFSLQLSADGSGVRSKK